MSSAAQRAPVHRFSPGSGFGPAGQRLRDRLADPAERADALREVATDDALAAATCDLLGLDAPIGTLLPSRLPPSCSTSSDAGSKDFQALGRLGRFEHDDRGRVVFRHIADDGSRIPRESWLLVEVYAALRARRTRHLSRQELSRWTIRLLVDLAAIDIPPVAAGEKPTGIEEATWARLQAFFDIRLWTDPEDAFPLTRGFLSDWCGLRSAKRAEEILKVLRREVLVAVEIGPGRDNPTYLYRLRVHVADSELIDDKGYLATTEFVEQRNSDRERREAAKKAGTSQPPEATS
jgi:hypothetical protein